MQSRIAVLDLQYAAGHRALPPDAAAATSAVPAREASQAVQRATAAQLRRLMLNKILQDAAAGKWLQETYNAQGEAHRVYDVWAAAQALSAAFRAPEASEPELRELLKSLQVLLAPERMVTGGGVSYGFRSGKTSFNFVLPTLWATAALAGVLRRPSLLSPEEWRRLTDWLLAVQQTTRTYHPLDTGGWNLFPAQLQPASHNIYASTLALLALQEVRAAHLPWEGSEETRDRLLRTTASGLIQSFDRFSDPPGWRPDPAHQEPISDGLTLLLYAALLREEAEGGVFLPEVLLREIPRYLQRLAERSIDYPVASGRFFQAFTAEDGRVRDENMLINFPWYASAVECTWRWLRRADRSPTGRSEMLSQRRILGHLLEIGKQHARQVTQNTSYTYLAADALYGLAAVPPP